MQRSGRNDGSDVRRILSAMVTDDTVCGRISSHWSQFGLFKSKYANIVGSWCVAYFKKYGSAPNNQLTSLFQEWAGDNPNNDETIDLIERFLQFTSDEHRTEENRSSDYYIDLAAKHFNKIRLEKTIEHAQADLEHGKIEDAQNRLTRSKPFELGLGSYVEPAGDFQIWDDAFSIERRRPLITYSAAAGKFFGDAFVREELYAFMAPDKTAKTTFLIDLGYRAIRRRNKVVFFDVGDGDQNEVLIRLGCRASEKSEYPCEAKMPLKWTDSSLIYKTMQYGAVDPIDAFRSFQKVSKAEDAFRISCHPNSSIGIDGIDNILDRWEQDNWCPSVCIIDYADILAPPKGIKDKLDQIDETWKALRRLSQQRHCLVVTATQSSAAAYGKEKGLLGRQHFSGRKTKLAHVNGMIGINVTEDERTRQEARLNWVVKRKIRDRKNRQKYVTVAGCYDIENPVIISK